MFLLVVVVLLDVEVLLVVVPGRVTGTIALSGRAALPRVPPLLQLLDRLLRDEQLVGQVLDPLAHQVLLLLLHHDGSLKRLLEPELLQLQLIVGVLSFPQVNSQRPNFFDGSVEVIEQDQELLRHVLPLHRLDSFQRRDLDGEQVRHGADLGKGGASGAGIGAGHGQPLVQLGVLELLLEGDFQLLLLVPETLLKLLLHRDHQPAHGFLLEQKIT